jgi:hypothetical protein
MRIHVEIPDTLLSSQEHTCESDSLEAGGFCAPCVAQAHQAATRAAQEAQEDPGLKALAAAKSDAGDDTGDDDDSSDEAVPEQVPFSGPIGFEGQYTGDGRFIALGALRVDEETMPQPVRYVESDTGGHDGAYAVGLFEKYDIRPDGVVWAEGFIDTTTEMGMKVYRGMKNGTIGGISMDLDSLEATVYARSELLGDEAPADAEAASEDAPEGYEKLGDVASDDMVLHITGARLRSATLVQIPAFANAKISLNASGAFEWELDGYTAISVLTAAAPVNPPAAWFENPRFTEPTPLTFTTDGRVYGHIAIWGTCHTGFPGTCVTPPRSNTNYAYFRTGILVADDGTEIPVGHLTMDTGHAGPNMSAAAAMAHYDNTGVVGADVAAGEDDFGIWVNGAIRPDLSDEEIRALRSAPMSGDWRRIGGNLELMAVLAVNLPGFPVLRTKALVASGQTQTLLAPIETESTVNDPEKAEKEAFSVVIEDLRAKLRSIRRTQLSSLMEKEA